MKLIFLISILVLIFACTKKASGISISVEQLRSLLRENPSTTIIYVRTIGGFNGPLGHIDGEKLIPLSEISTSIANLKSDNKDVYYMIFKSGARSGKATQMIKKEWFKCY